MPIGTNFNRPDPTLGFPTMMQAAPVMAPAAGPVKLPAPAELGGPVQPANLWQRLQGTLQQPGMSGALLRAGAALMSGGSMADAVTAGGNYAEGLKRWNAQQTQQGIENSQRDRQLGQTDAQIAQTGAHYQRADANEAAQTANQAAYQQGSLANQGREIDNSFALGQLRDATDRRGQDISSATSRYSTDSSAGNVRAEIASRASEGAADRASQEKIWAGRNATSAGNAQTRAAAGIGSRAAKPPTKTVLSIPSAPTDPGARTANQVYRTPKGLFQWTGTGWLPVAG